MINYFVTREHAYTVSAFLTAWVNAVRDLVRIVPYESMPLITSVRPGVYIFSDIERLDPRQTRNVRQFCDFLAARLASPVILNHPGSLLRRYDLLQRLWRQGINQFRAFPCDYLQNDIRYPVFLRIADDHDGPLTGLLGSPAEHRRALAEILSAGRNPSQVITIEFCDTRGADGLYRKFSAFRIGDQIVPGHVLFSPDWVTKDSGPEPLREEERAYLASNPHREELTKLFNLAGITYGRIDYGLLAGKIQVWEINTNPTVIREREKYSADKLPLKQQLVDQLSLALLALHRQVDCVPLRRVAVPAKRVEAAGFPSRTWFRRLFRGLSL